MTRKIILPSEVILECLENFTIDELKVGYRKSDEIGYFTGLLDAFERVISPGDRQKLLTRLELLQDNQASPRVKGRIKCTLQKFRCGF